MNNFIETFDKITNITTTENGKLCYNTTNSKVMDFFAISGAMRNRTEEDILRTFIDAYNEDEMMAIKTLFYTRDIRDGLGERRTFKVILHYMGNNLPATVAINLSNIARFGRWDDYFCLIDTKCEDLMWDYLYEQWKDDIKNYRKNKPISLLAKWLKSVNTSSKESVKIARATCDAFGISERQYRKTLSKLRKYLKVVEVQMSQQDWENIDYSIVPSKAMNNYRNCFKKHSEEKFNDYLQAVKNGDKKINTGAIYPYEIIEKYNYYNLLFGYEETKITEDETLELQWKNLPNYVTEGNNVLVMADTSGSMITRPMDIALSLAIYYAERNRGTFANRFMTFSTTPTLVKLKENSSLLEKLKSIKTIVSDTNLELAMETILNLAVVSNCTQEELPKALIVISDMEINYMNNVDFEDIDFANSISKKFEEKGYKMPKIIYWNVDSRQNTFLSQDNNEYISFVSGSSPTVFKYVNYMCEHSAYDVMLEILSNPVYDCIKY